MKHSSGAAWDKTGDSAVGDVAGESLLAEVFSRIEDERDRVLILAHIGLDISIRNLARALGTSRMELADRVSSIIMRLREDTDLVSILGDIHRAGQNDRYQALVFRLGLQDWFCSYCGGFMLQSEIGRKRETCSGKCRQRLWRADGIGWKKQEQGLPLSSSHSEPELAPLVSIEGAYQGKLLALLRLIRVGERSLAWRAPETNFSYPAEIRSRDRAMLLLGFTCPIPLSPLDLAAIDVDDIARNPAGLEVRLYRRADKRTRYVIIPTGVNPELCPAAAVLDWKNHLMHTGRSNGPLFTGTDSWGYLPSRSARLTGQKIVGLIINAVQRAGLGDVYTELKPSTFLPGFLNEIWTPAGFVDTVRSGTMVYEERTGSGTGAQEVHPGI